MNRVAFSFFNIDIYWYSLFILFGIIICYIIVTRESKKHNLDTNFVLDLIFYGIIIGILGARIYYVLFNLKYYLNNPIEILAFRNGGLAIHGGIISGICFVYFYCKKHNVNFLKMLDILSPGVIIAQAIGRWGNFFNMEAHGGITTYEKLKEINIPKFIIHGMKINGNYYYPTFYFESIWCILGFIVLVILRKRKSLKIGTITGMYFIWYSMGRFFIEALRTDSLRFFDIRIAQLVSVAGIIIGLILIFKKNKKDYYEVIK